MKNVQYPEEIQKIVDEVMLKDIHDEDAIVEQVKSEHKGQWDIPIDQEVVFLILIYLMSLLDTFR